MMQVAAPSQTQCTGCLLSSGIQIVFDEPAAEHPVGPSTELYEIIEVMGRGGMGVVHRARHRVMGRDVALKTIPVEKSSFTAIQRFHLEVAAAARLQHSNILPIYDFGEEEGVPYYTMRLIEGAQTVLRLRRCADARHVASVVSQIARGVDHAHRQGVLHRDLKPSNILVDAEDTPYITDFGLAKLTAEEAGDDALTLTRDSDALGSPSYMAPEQVAGGTVTTAVDVYGLGAILYDLLTGEPPFKEDTALATLNRVRQGHPEPPTQRLPDIPKEMEIICLKAMALEPEDRYESAGSMAVDLIRFASDQPILAKPPSKRRQLQLFVKRNPAISFLACATALAILLGMLGVHWQWRQAVAEATLRRQSQQRTERLLYESNMALIDTRPNLGNARLRTLLKEAEPADYHGFEYHYWQRQLNKSPQRVFHHPHPVNGLAFSPNGKTIATGCSSGSQNDDGIVTLRERDEETKVRTLETTFGKVEFLLFTPDGEQLIAASGPTISVWEMASGRLITRFETPPSSSAPHRVVSGLSHVPGFPDQLALSTWGNTLGFYHRESGALVREFQPKGPAGLGIGGEFALSPIASEFPTHPGRIWNHETGALVHDHGDIWNTIGRFVYSRDGKRIAFQGTIFDAKTGEVVQAKEDARRHHHPALSPDGEWFATAYNGDLYMASTRFPAYQVVLHQPRYRDVWDLAFSPDSQWLLAAGDHNEVALWSREAWAPFLMGHGSLAEGNHRIPAVAVSPDGTHTVTVAADGKARVWETSTRRLVRTIHAHSKDISGVAFLPSGTAFITASNDGLAKVWDVETGLVRLTLTEHKDELWCTAASHNGRFLATGGRDRTVIVWDTVSGRRLQTFLHPDAVSAIAFSPDDRTIATGGDDHVARLWDVETGEERVACVGHADWVAEVAFLPDGKRLVTASADQSVRLWSAASGQLLRIYHGHTDEVGGLTVSPDGHRIISGALDQTIRIWDVNSDRQLLTLHSPSGPVHGLALSPDGRQLVSAAHYAAAIW